MTRQIFLDTETTGLEVTQGHRIVELACVEMVNRRLTKRNFHHYLNPEREIDPGAQQIHGISSEFLADKPRFADICDEFLDYLGDAELVIHNAAFDVGFVNAELRLVGRPPLDEFAGAKRSIIDTWKLAKEQFPGKKNSLDALCERLEVDNSARTLHGALLDAELLADVYLALTRGQDSLDIGLAAAPVKGVSVVPAVRPAGLKVLRATAEELSAHAKVIEGLQQASGGKAVWSAEDLVAKPEAATN
ncbi:MAG: DNA polymerase III subunit epsilon [Burkholderiales bacterium]|jgi:DNA polymerase-3 subunit epsilon|nr:DNA polymerase III subunit epsilon [Nitrosomonadaceae bacterium]